MTQFVGARSEVLPDVRVNAVAPTFMDMPFRKDMLAGELETGEGRQMKPVLAPTIPVPTI